MSKPLIGESINIDKKEYDDFSAFLQVACGIYLGDNKQYLVSTRVRRILNEHGLKSLADLTTRIASDKERALRQQVLDAMTTNETFWFRDIYPYEFLSKTLLPDLNAQKKGSAIRIWSAACSTGQEPYSISIIAEEYLRSAFAGRASQVDILATDLSSQALEIAKRGNYDRISVVRGLAEHRMKMFFTENQDGTWCVQPKIKSRIRFRPMNLQESFYLLGKFDVIFCRNVLIYFSTDLKNEILTKLHGALNPKGMLFLGSSESVTGVNHLFELVNCKPGVAYRAK